MLVRISQRSALAALHATRVHAPRYAYSTRQSSSEHQPRPDSQSRPLDTSDTHLLTPSSNTLPTSTPLEEVSQKLQLPLGGESQVESAGLHPAEVIERPSPATPSPGPPAAAQAKRPDRVHAALEQLERDATDPPAVSQQSTHAEEQVSPPQRPEWYPSLTAADYSPGDLPADMPLDMTFEETPAAYGRRRVKVTISSGWRHMAIVLTVVRRLEQEYGRITHFAVERVRFYLCALFSACADTANSPPTSSLTITAPSTSRSSDTSLSISLGLLPS